MRFWYNIAFAIPSIVFTQLVMRWWCKQTYGWSAICVKTVQNYAHLYAIRDKLMGSMVTCAHRWLREQSLLGSRQHDYFVASGLFCTVVHSSLDARPDMAGIVVLFSGSCDILGRCCQPTDVDLCMIREDSLRLSHVEPGPDTLKHGCLKVWRGYNGRHRHASLWRQITRP
jgi:hypothetical protein